MERRPVGRPPTGIQERVRLSTFLSPEARALLEAACRALDKPSYLVLEDSLLESIRRMEPSRRKPIEEAAAVLLRRRRERTGDRG